MAVDPNVHPVWAEETKVLAQHLDKMDYFQVLGVTPETPFPEIKAQYHTLQRAYHPDTFYQSPDDELRRAVFKIAKRVAEAYVILRDDARRKKYAKDIAGEARDKKLRYSEESEQSLKKEKEEELGKTPQARQLVQKAMAQIKAGNLAQAEKDLKTALLFEAGNETIKARLEEVREKIKASAPAAPAKPGVGPKKPGP